MERDAFEAIAMTAARENVTLELIGGRIGVKPAPDGDHGEIVMWLLERCLQQRPDLRLYPGRGLKVESCRSGRARPDGALTARGTFAGQGEWAEPQGVLMVVEVTSHDADADRRDRVEKPAAYIPVYLLVDRDARSVTVFSEPEHGAYTSAVTLSYGHTVVLPDPVGVTLDTEDLKAYVR